MATTTKASEARRSTRPGERRRDDRAGGREDRSTSSGSSRSRARSGNSSSGGTRGRGEAGELRITAKNLRAPERRWLEQHGSQLSPTTLRAKWIHSVDEHEDRAGQTLATREPAVIQAWAEDRDAEPATVGRKDPNQRPRTLRLDFNASGGRDDRDRRPQRAGNSRLQPIDWDAWLRTFEERDLVFLYQEHRRNGGGSNFFRLDSPKREDG